MTTPLQVAIESEGGWWFKAASEAFGFLASDHDYQLAEVSTHFRGHDLTYGGAAYRVTVELEPESNALWADIWVVEDRAPLEYPKVISVVDLLEHRAPGSEWALGAASGGLSPRALATVMRTWADGLRQHAPDLLAGEPLAGISWAVPTVTLFRAVGPKELALVEASGWTAWPPRPLDKPMFVYPVDREDRARSIARDLAAKATSDHRGFVTRFEVRADWLSGYHARAVAAFRGRAYRFMGDDLEALNAVIVGPIEMVVAYEGGPGKEPTERH